MGGIIMSEADKVLAEKILEQLGGAANVISYTNCMTRLRVTPADSTKVNQDGIKKIDGVLGLVEEETLQIIIGPGRVTRVTEEFGRLLDASGEISLDKKAASKKAELKQKIQHFHSPHSRAGCFRSYHGHHQGHCTGRLACRGLSNRNDSLGHRKWAIWISWYSCRLKCSQRIRRLSSPRSPGRNSHPQPCICYHYSFWGRIASRARRLNWCFDCFGRKAGTPICPSIA
jgi:glucose-like phosphotransferase system IIB component